MYKYYSVLLTIEFSVFSNVNLPHHKNNMILVSHIFIVSTDWLAGFPSNLTFPAFYLGMRLAWVFVPMYTYVFINKIKYKNAIN